MVGSLAAVFCSLRRARRAVALAVIAAILGTAIGAGPAGADPGPDDLLRFFDRLAVTDRTPDGGQQPGWVRKWTRSVAVRLEGRVTDQHRATVREITLRLSVLTGIQFYLADHATKAGNRLTVRILSHQDMMRIQGGSGPVCTAATFGNGGVLHTGWIEVSERYTDCLHHEFMHALGFDNHWAGRHATVDVPSVLALRRSPARVADYSLFDEVAIRLLYDTRLRPGMRRARALSAARNIVAVRFDFWYASAQSRTPTEQG
jgi:hypothetical protein